MQGEGEITFARKASGLVRGLSMWDAFGVGFMNQGLTPSIWVMISLGLSVYLGGNLIIATVLSLVLAGIGFPLVWGILGGSMPRSGGRVHLQLPHPAPLGGDRRVLRQRLHLAHVDLRAGSLDGRSGLRHAVGVHGLGLALQLGDRARSSAVSRTRGARSSSPPSPASSPSCSWCSGSRCSPGCRRWSWGWASSAPSSSWSCCSCTASRTSSTPGTPWRLRTAR